MVISFALAWPLYFLTPVLATVLLASPQPSPDLRQAARLLGYVVAAFALGLVFTLVLAPFPLAFAPGLALALFHVYHLANRGGPVFLVLMMLLALLILPMLAQAHGALATGFAFYFPASAALAVLIYVLAHGVFPDPPGPPARAGARAPPRSGDRREAALAAAKSTAVIWPLAVLFVAANWSSQLLVLIFAALFSLSPDLARSRAAGKASLLSTSIGGVTALAFFALLAAAPTLHFFAALTLLTTLVFATAIFSGHRLGPFLPSALSAVIVLVASAMDPDVDLTQKFLERLVLIGAATLYVVAGLAALNAWLPAARDAVRGDTGAATR